MRSFMMMAALSCSPALAAPPLCTLPAPIAISVADSEAEPPTIAAPHPPPDALASIPFVQHVSSAGALMTDLGEAHGIRAVAARSGDQFMLFQVTPDGQAAVSGAIVELTPTQLQTIGATFALGSIFLTAWICEALVSSAKARGHIVGVAIVTEVLLTDRRHTLRLSIVGGHVGPCLAAQVVDLGDRRRHGEGLHRGRLRADAAVERSAGDRARGLLVADLRVPHVALEAGIGGVGGVDDLLERADRSLLIVRGLGEALLQQLLDRAKRVVTEEAGDRAGGAQ